MNSSAFSCAVRVLVASQQAGKVEGFELLPGVLSPGSEAESVTCSPVYTKRPHCCAAGMPMGVLKLK